MVSEGDPRIFPSVPGRSEGDIPAGYQDTNCAIFNPPGNRLEHVDNTIADCKKASRRVPLPAGRYLVKAQPGDYFNSSGIRINGGDFVLGGSVVDGLLARRSGTDQSLGQDILGLPVIRLFIPERLPSSSGDEGSYPARAEPSSLPWNAISTRAPASGDFNSSFNDEPQSGFISLGR
jgi:hypothetical protein